MGRLAAAITPFLFRVDGYRPAVTATASHDDSQSARVQVRPYANPLPLGFFSFGIGMVVLAGIGLGLISGEEMRTAGILLAGFVFPPEFLAAVLAFLARDTGAAGALGLFATSWLGLGTVYIVSPTQQASIAVGLFEAAFALMLVPLAVTAFSGKRLLGLVLVFSVTRSGLAAAYQLGAPHALQVANTVAAFALFALSLYAGTAFLIEDLRQNTVLPILRRGPARDAIEGDLPDQHSRLAREPGVRQQL